MFDLERREKFILLALMAMLLVGIAIGLHQKRRVYVDVRPAGFSYPAEGFSREAPRININESDAAGLMQLKGVGVVLAGRIIEYRQRSGAFMSIEDLKKVKGLGQKLYEKIKDKVCVD